MFAFTNPKREIPAVPFQDEMQINKLMEKKGKKMDSQLVDLGAFFDKFYPNFDKLTMTCRKDVLLTLHPMVVVC